MQENGKPHEEAGDHQDDLEGENHGVCLTSVDNTDNGPILALPRVTQAGGEAVHRQPDSVEYVL
ncbi:hypothetical protein CVA01_13530 [Corynebacterium variabile]|uniref:Uncharacterized protein n=1 Tax=Corynebacterium variabile TaxID=1727 RepID=A0A4Y4C2M0_9CORY|nr:hypothetical protein CVA01_13530 [Corynebacterium variabile]